ncbi:hypothetical protein GOV12_08180 [Candidatus Pacearchaeota archaeon]|nr:hypothetical protein [Candidatus Pacearchaeota archaeon]
MKSNNNGFKISPEAREIGKRLISSVPRNKLLRPRRLVRVGSRYLSTKGLRPSLIGIKFPDTDFEKKDLSNTIMHYNSLNRYNSLILSGIPDVNHVSQILLDNRLEYLNYYDSTGKKSYKPRFNQKPGYSDNGWGVLVFDKKTIKKNNKKSNNNQFFEVPLEEFQAILFPSPLVQIIENEFPQFSNQIKGYQEFADELKLRLQNQSRVARSITNLIGRLQRIY